MVPPEGVATVVPGAATEKNVNAIVADFKTGQRLFQSAPPVETAAFRDWFGDSRVVDADGQPLLVYRGEHGESDRDFHSRLPSLTFGSKAAANTYAQQPNNPDDAPAKAPRLTPVYLRIENPIIETRDDPYVDLSDIEARLGRNVAAAMARKHADAIGDLRDRHVA